MKLNPLQVIFLVLAVWLGYEIYYLGSEWQAVFGIAQPILPVMVGMLVLSSYRFNFWDVLLFILMPICYVLWTTALGLTVFLMGKTALIDCVGQSGMLLLRILDYQYGFFIQNGIIIDRIPYDLSFLLMIYAACISIICIVLWAIKVAR